MYFKQNRDVGMCYWAHNSCYFVVVFRNMWTSQDGNYKYDLLEYVDTLDSMFKSAQYYSDGEYFYAQ